MGPPNLFDPAHMLLLGVYLVLSMAAFAMYGTDKRAAEEGSPMSEGTLASEPRRST